jgi:hypoxanthine phosphoribosyltransferase
MPELFLPLKKDDISKMVTVISQRISSDYQNRQPDFYRRFKWRICFLSDLIRNLEISLKIDFVGVSSCGQGTSSSGTIHLTKEIGLDLQGKISGL